jgi:segregation and condensation protein A
MSAPDRQDPPFHTIQTENFEGPLDLLLHLIRKNRMNILDIQLSEITSEYLFHLERKQGINPSRESDFLITAATLIYIKSRTLLPKPEILADESPEKSLINSLLEHAKVQKISRLLQDMEHVELMLWRREAIVENFSTREFTLQEVSAFQLAEIFFSVVRKKEKEEFLYVTSKNYSIDEKKRELLSLLDQQDYLDFSTYLLALDSIEELLVSFFTLLELIKRHKLIAIQKELFGAIALWKLPGEEQQL